METDRWFTISFWVCCALLVVPLSIVEYLPMVDLPQHAAQIGIWERWSDTELGYPRIYTRNWFTPYLLGYVLAFLLTSVMSVKAAITTVVTAAVVAVPLAARLLLRESGGNRWWVFAVFPSVFGFAFDWGFLNFIVGVPVALVSLIAVFRHVDAPSWRSSMWLTAVMLALVFVHVLLFGYVALILSVAVLMKREGWRTVVLSLVPILVVSPLVLIWIHVTRSSEVMTRRPMIWELPSEKLRALRALAEIAGDGLSAWTVVVGLFALLLPILLGGRPSRTPLRWAPFIISLLLFLLMPFELFGTAYLYPRFAIFLIPTWLYAMDVSKDRKPSPLRLMIGPAFAIACTAATTVQFRGYAGEVIGLADIIEEMPANARVLSVPVDRSSKYVRTPVFLHAPAWYQASKGGVVDFSFAMNFPSLFRYRPETEPEVPQRFVWNTGLFDWDAFDGNRYDYLVVRDVDEQPSPLIVRSGAPVELVARRGPWQLFRRSEASRAR